MKSYFIYFSDLSISLFLVVLPLQDFILICYCGKEYGDCTIISFMTMVKGHGKTEKDFNQLYS